MMFLNSFRISTRVYLLAGIKLFLLILIGSVSLFQMDKIGSELADIAEEDIPITKALTELTELQLQQAIYFERALVAGLARNQNLQTEHSIQELTNKFNSLAVQAERGFKELEDKVQHAIDHSHLPETVSEFKALLKSIKQIDIEHKRYDEEASQLLSQFSGDAISGLMTQVIVIEQLEDKIDDALIKALHQVEEFTLQASIRAEQDEKQALKLILTIFAFSLAIALVLPLIISRAITRPVNAMTERLKELTTGDGDLTVRLDDSAGDETAEAAREFNGLLHQLSNMVKQINSTSEKLCERSEVTVAQMGNTVDSIDSQQRETETVAAAVEELAATVTQVAKTTEEAASLAALVRDHVATGHETAVESSSLMKELSEDVSEAAVAIETLANETNRITEVLDAIRGIAEQTNLLALNAAIEAARAGESGRGFAVVADEVRALAQRTQSSTDDIQKLLENLQSQASSAVKTMERGKANADSCLQKATSTAEALQAGNGAVNEISELNIQIATATEQQSYVAHEISGSLVHINEVATSTNADAHETASASQLMAEDLVALRQYIAKFKV